MENIVLTREDPNSDIIEVIYRLENRAEKLLTLSLAVMSLSAFLNSVTLVLIVSPFFLVSFIFYLLTFTQSPTIIALEMSRAELYALFELKMKQTSVPSTEIKSILDAQKEMRKLLINSRKKKSTYMQIATSSFFSFIFILFTSYIIIQLSPSFFKNITQTALYIAVFVLNTVILFMLLYKHKSKQVQAYKGNINITTTTNQASNK